MDGLVSGFDVQDWSVMILIKRGSIESYPPEAAALRDLRIFKHSLTETGFIRELKMGFGVYDGLRWSSGSSWITTGGRYSGGEVATVLRYDCRSLAMSAGDVAGWFVCGSSSRVMGRAGVCME